MPGGLDLAHRIEYPALRGIWPKRPRLLNFSSPHVQQGIVNPQGMHGMMQAPMQQPVLFCPVQPIYMLHYAAFQDQHATALACEDPALKKRRQQPRRQCEETLSTVSTDCAYEVMSDDSSTEQNGEVPMKGSVAATVNNYRKRNEDIIDLFLYILRLLRRHMFFLPSKF